MSVCIHRCTIVAVAAWALSLPLSVKGERLAIAPLAAVPPFVNPVDAPANRPEKLRWSQVCVLSINDDRLSIKCDLSIDQLKRLTEEVELEGMPGLTSVLVTPRRYEVQNEHAGEGTEVVYVRILGSRSTVSIEVQRIADGKTSSISFTQSGSYGRQSGRNTECRLTAYGPGIPGEMINVEAGDLVALRKEFPHEVNRYLRPMFRELGADLFQISPATARQVLFSTEDEANAALSTPGASTQPGVSSPGTLPSPPSATRPVTTQPVTRPAIDPALAAQVRRLLKEFDSPVFRQRETAAEQLTQLGPRGIAAILRVDRESLSPQQALLVDSLVAVANPLSAEQARRLKSDVHFLIDCLYMPNKTIRSAAADRLMELIPKGKSRLAESLALDPKTAVAKSGVVIERLREEIAPAGK